MKLKSQGPAVSCRKPRSGACGAFRAACGGLGRSWEGLWLSRARLGALLRGSRVPLGRSWSGLGDILGRSWSDLRGHLVARRCWIDFLIDLGCDWGRPRGAFGEAKWNKYRSKNGVEKNIDLGSILDRFGRSLGEPKTPLALDSRSFSRFRVVGSNTTFSAILGSIW